MMDHRNHFNLLDECFPGIKANIVRTEKIGFPWVSKPFLKEEKGEIISHAGVLEYPMLVEGRLINAAALHAICTKPTNQGKGLASELIEKIIEWAKGHYELLVLFTEIPAFYEKLSFKSLQEFRFHLRVNHTAGTKALRQIQSPADDSLFKEIFRNRAALSNRLWVRDNGVFASFNSLFATYPYYWSLFYSDTLNGFISYQIEGKTLHLFDLVSNSIPSLDMILDHFSQKIEEIIFYFSPDRIASDAEVEPYRYDNSYFMAYGNWPLSKPFMVSPLARC